MLSQANQFSNQQTDLEIKADDIIFGHLKKSGVVHSAASEVKPYVSLKLRLEQIEKRECRLTLYV